MEHVWNNAHANFLSRLSAKELGKLLKYSHRRTIKRGDAVFELGEASKTVYMVMNGCVKLCQVSRSGREIITWFSFPGEIFGLAELVAGSDRKIFAKATVGSEVLGVPRWGFLAFLREHPEVSMLVTEILSARYLSARTSFVDLVSDDVETRLARLLHRFASVSKEHACDHPRTSNEVCINVKLTHGEIANLIGAARQTVTSSLSSLKQRGVITPVDDHLHIASTVALDQVLHPISP